MLIVVVCLIGELEWVVAAHSEARQRGRENFDAHTVQVGRSLELRMIAPVPLARVMHLPHVVAVLHQGIDWRRIGGKER
jgi:hypothetical protein